MEVQVMHQDPILRRQSGNESDRPFPCPWSDCTKAFGRRSDLARHHRIHTNERPYCCNYCDKSFIQRSALTVHIRVHTGERPHGCEWIGCGKTFSDSSSLARHRRIHTGKRPYGCHVKSCDKTFCRKTTLTKHLRRAHQQGAPLALDQMASTPSDSDESDEDDEYTPKGSRTRAYAHNRSPLTPPTSTRRISNTAADLYPRQPMPQYAFFPHTPLSQGRPFSSPNSQSHYRGNQAKISDVFASVEHGNDYSFFRDVNGNPMLSPAPSRGSTSTEYYSPHVPSSGSVFSDGYSSSPHPMIRSQSDVGVMGLGLNINYHPQQSFSMPPAWLTASRALQYVTSDDMESHGHGSMQHFDIGSLEPALTLSEHSGTPQQQHSEHIDYESQQPYGYHGY